MYKISTSTGKKFNFPSGLEDITLEQYIQYLEMIEPTKPKYLKDIDNALEELMTAREQENEEDIQKANEKLTQVYDSITNIVMYKHIFPYYARVISFFTEDLSEEEILGKDGGDGMNVAQLQQLFSFVSDIFNKIEEPEYEHIITVNGENWYLPQRFMTESTVIEFAESSQFEQNLKDVAAGQWKALAKVMCVIVRKDGEKYSDKLLQQRESMFMKWNLKDCMKVSFFLLKRSEISHQNLQIYMAAQNLMKLKQGLSS
jgi:hypothetical protein